MGSIFDNSPSDSARNETRPSMARPEKMQRATCGRLSAPLPPALRRAVDACSRVAAQSSCCPLSQPSLWRRAQDEQRKAMSCDTTCLRLTGSTQHQTPPPPLSLKSILSVPREAQCASRLAVLPSCMSLTNPEARESPTASDWDRVLSRWGEFVWRLFCCPASGGEHQQRIRRMEILALVVNSAENLGPLRLSWSITF